LSSLSRKQPYRAVPDRTPSATHALPIGECESAPATSTDPDLAAVIAAWDRLPAALKDGILAMIKAALGTSVHG
jgi:hypothetical protein